MNSMKLLTILSIACLIAPTFAANLYQAQRLEFAETVGEASMHESLSAKDWSGIVAARHAAQERFTRTPDGAQAFNPSQGWRLSFDQRGFEARPASRSWTWGMDLLSFGLEGAECTLGKANEVVLDGNRLEYEWGSGLKEWYVNGSAGLEHGFTLQRRPSGQGLLRLRLSVRGDLKGEALPCASGLVFRDNKGSVALHYTGLRVFDALGVDQSARLSMEDGKAVFTIEESRAVYPLTIDPIAQEVYLKASNPGPGDDFGWAVAVSGDTAAVGAFSEDSASGGIDGDQSNNSASNAGAVYVFVKTAGVWSQQAYIKAPHPGSTDRFGYALALDGDRLVVGAFQEDSDATGIDGDSNNDNATNSGAAFVFERTNGVWSQAAYLKASNAEPHDSFGYSVAVSGDWIAVGADDERSGSAGVNMGQFDNSVSQSGAVYVFHRDPSGWSQEAYVKASNPSPFARFGSSVVISADSLVVGAWGDSSAGVGMNGDQGGGGETYGGAAYIFDRVGGTWVQSAFLKPNFQADQSHFGRRVSLSDGTAVVGAGQLPPHGAAYVYHRSISGWQLQAVLEADDPSGVINFGRSVCVDGDKILVGSSAERGGATGVNGQPGATPSLHHSGAAYLFERQGTDWSQTAYIKASNAGAWDGFAHEVALSDSLAIVGAPSEDGGFSGPYAPQSDNSVGNSGAAYVFQLDAEWANYCGPAPSNSAGTDAWIDFSGSLSIASNDFVLKATGLPPGQLGFFLNSTGQRFVANPGGSQGHLCLGNGPIGRHNRPHELMTSNAMGEFELTLDLQDLPQPIAVTTALVGEEWNFQAWYRDQNPGAASNFSNGLSVRFQP